MTYANRSEFLFCYDARMTNPNGDPDENRPRIDLVSGKNLVTEFRLKRTIRDYLKDVLNKDIFMRVEETEQHQLKTIEDLAAPYIITNTITVGKKKEEQKELNREKLVTDHIDLRLFGLLFAVGGIHFKQVGPIQFAIGRSLNKVEELTIRITRVVPTREEAKAGTFGEKSVLRYSFIVFHGFLNDIVAKQVDLSEDDVKQMMQAMWFGTDELSTTSKFGQRSRLLLRVNYSKPFAYIGDLDRYIAMKKNDKNDANLDKLEDVSQFFLDIQGLLNILTRNKDVMSSIEYASSDELICYDGENTASFQSLIDAWAKENKVSCLNLMEKWKPKNG